MAEEYDFLFKSIVVGDGGVGKTALTLRFSKGFFTEDYKMTIGVDFHVKTISIDASEGPIKCKLQLWDTGGQERFSSIRPMYYRGSLGTVLVFDLTNSESFGHLPQWIQEVRANIKADIPVLLVGNKSDLVDQRAVSAEDVSKFTRDFNLYYMETSAKTGDGVGDCFYILACLMIGQGVPEQLIANSIVFAPGQFATPTIQISSQPIVTKEPQSKYIAPSVPGHIQNLKEEPEIEFEAPPVPEPKLSKVRSPTSPFISDSEIEFEAPPVPEPRLKAKPQPAPEISLPEPTEIEFKTPDEIMIKEAIKSELDTLTSGENVYKPKTAPFTPNAPEPTAPPKEFQSSYSEGPIERSPIHTPFRVIKREESPKPQPASMTFEPSPSPQPESTESLESTSDSLIDYMPQTILTKKEKKKQAKEKKKQEKEKAKIEKEKKILEEREKQEELIKEMKKSKKSKKEKPIVTQTSEPTQAPTISRPETGMNSLFQTLTQKSEVSPPDQSVPFIPFSGTSKTKEEGTSKLRIIPNVADIDASSNGFTAFSSSQSNSEEEPKAKTKDLLICEQCGSILSADYAYCNKCGNKL